MILCEMVRVVSVITAVVLSLWFYYHQIPMIAIVKILRLCIVEAHENEFKDILVR